MKGERFIADPENARPVFAALWKRACQFLQLDKSVKVVLSEAKIVRTLPQNDKMWAMLTDISLQLKWPVDGVEQFIEPEDWKDILSAGLKKHQRVAKGILGGFVILGSRTRDNSVEQQSELIEFMLWFGAEKKIIWSEPCERPANRVKKRQRRSAQRRGEV